MSSQIQTIIFSKDNPIRLDILLDSIHKNTNNLFKINVLYIYTNDYYNNIYEKIIKKQSNVNFIKTSSFKDNVLNLLKTELEYSCFFTDNDYVFGELKQ